MRKESESEHTKVRITLLTVLSDNQGIILVVLLEELLGVVVAIDVDLRERIVDGLLLVASRESGFKERQEKLQAVSGLDLANELVNWDRCRVNSGQEVLDHRLVAVDIEQSTNHGWGSGGIDTLHINLNRAKLLVLVEVEDQVVDEVKSVADNDER
jgi:hypothetical protein